MYFRTKFELMLENLSPEMQLVAIIVGLAVLFVLVMLNHKHNQRKRHNIKDKGFGRKTSERRKNK